MTRSLGLATGGLVGLLLAVPALGNEGLYLHVIDTAAPAGPLPVDSPWRVELSLHDAVAGVSELPAALGATLVEQSPARRVAFRVEADVVVGGAIGAADTAPSFIVDFDEPSVVALRATLVGANAEAWLGGRPPIDELVAFTDRSIPRKTVARGWDFASRVAREGEGDCTEHAVLLAALARSFGYPARVAIGLALVVPAEGESEVGAFGHAWAEIHDGDGWHAADATSIGREARAVRLVPLALLADEGPGYQADLFRLIRLLPSRVDITAAEGRD